MTKIYIFVFAREQIQYCGGLSSRLKDSTDIGAKVEIKKSHIFHEANFCADKLSILEIDPEEEFTYH
jgi:hypothetical protein